MSEDTREDFEAVIKELEVKETTAQAANSLIDKDDPAKDEPTKDDPAKDDPAKDEPTKEDPAKDEPTKEEPAKDEPATDGVKDDPLLTQDKAPAAWSPKVREQWATIPKEVRDEILRREDASVKGVRQLQEETAPMRGFVQQLDPFIKEALNSGANPGQYIGQVMASERALRNPDENARFEALLAIADQYRIPLREVINASVGREVLSKQAAPTAVPQAVQQELEANRQWRAQQEEQSMVREIETFARDPKHEFFQDVRSIMGDLMQANAATNLEEAYEKAIWAHAETRAVLLERQSKQGGKDKVAERQAAAAKVSAKTNETIGVKTGKTEDDEGSLEDDIRASIAAMAGRA